MNLNVMFLFSIWMISKINPFYIYELKKKSNFFSYSKLNVNLERRSNNYSV